MSKNVEKKLTPMEVQYWQIKEEHPDIILFFRMGDFFEMFGDDARIASKELEIVLTSRSAGYAADMPMCGFPHHAADKYIARLVSKGYKVAVCDQLEDPKKTKKLVKRGVVRVVTPGTLIEDTMLDAKSNNFMCSIATSDKLCGISFIDISTGEFAVTEFGLHTIKTNISSEIARLNPAEILVDKNTPEDILNIIKESTNIKPELINLDFGYLDSEYKTLAKQFKTDSLRGFGIEDFTAGIAAANLIIKYIKDTNPSFLPSITGIANYSINGFLILDSTARRNLELTKTMSYEGKGGTLLSIIDRTKTAMGGRLLRSYIEQPLLDVDEINARLDVVNSFVLDRIMLEEVKKVLANISDIERIMSRVATETCSPRDLRALSTSIKNLPLLNNIFKNTTNKGLIDLNLQIIDLSDIAELIDNTIVDTPPNSLKDGGVICNCVNELLDEYRSATTDGKNWIISVETDERERTQIKNLKIGYNSVFGYYIEVSKSNVGSVPDYYIRKQTLTNAERYITPELKTIEEKILGASEKSIALEIELFNALREQIADNMLRIIGVARIIAKIDVFMSFADVASIYNYVKPVVNIGNEIVVKNGRHPVIEQFINGNFIPNDTYLNSDSDRLLIITGPNMAGKSTYMRQLALIVILAQIGSFVPADSADIGIVDRIFTRVGAHDELASGQSTFMVEMNETANIINNATENSLVILDEIGRGTSTYDGLSIAWSVAEELNKIGAKTLFATHYHYLNELEDQMEGIKNYKIAVREEKDRVVWLRKIMRGGTDKSYGIEVARLAGLPMNVIERSKEILALFETREVGNPKNKIKAKKDTMQLTLFDLAPDPILEELKKVDLNSISPIEALNYIYEWQKKLKN